MPYFVAVYDVGEKRVGKMLKLFRQYLNWVQNSVFEGELTKSQYKALEQAALSLMKEEEDSVIFYELREERYAERRVLGVERGNRSTML